MMPAIIAAEGTAFALLAGLDGSVTWQAARVLMGDRLGRLVHLPGRARRPGATAFALGIAGTAADAGAASAQLAPTRMWRSAPRMGTRLTASARPRPGPVTSYRPTFFTAALPSMTISPRWL
jgi:hypothetical protein